MKKGKITSHFTILFLLLIIFNSCEIINPDEKLAAFIKVDSVKFVSNYSIEGSSSHNITNVWHYIDGHPLGCFSIPSRIPSLITGNVILNTQAGIKLNGVSETRVSYPFYKAYIDTVMLQEGGIYTVNPIFYYDNSVHFAWIEDFESAGISLEKTLISDTTINECSDADLIFRNTQDYTESNKYSGLVHLREGYRTFEIQTIDAFDLPKMGTYVFLELNYKVSAATTVGIVANYNQSISKKPVVILNPTETWKKIYINLTQVVSREGNARDFRIYFSGGMEEGSTEEKYLFDNIKLIHTKTN